MKSLILIGIIILFSGCSVKSYTTTTVYRDRNITHQYQSIELFKSNQYNRPYCSCYDDNSCCNALDGMYIQDDLGW